MHMQRSGISWSHPNSLWIHCLYQDSRYFIEICKVRAQGAHDLAFACSPCFDPDPSWPQPKTDGYGFIPRFSLFYWNNQSPACWFWPLRVGYASIRTLADRRQSSSVTLFCLDLRYFIEITKVRSPFVVVLVLRMVYEPIRTLADRRQIPCGYIVFA